MSKRKDLYDPGIMDNATKFYFQSGIVVIPVCIVLALIAYIANSFWLIVVVAVLYNSFAILGLVISLRMYTDTILYYAERKMND